MLLYNILYLSKFSGATRNLILGVYVLTSHCNFKTRVNVPHVNKTVTDFGGIYTDIPPVATPLGKLSVKFSLMYRISRIRTSRFQCSLSTQPVKLAPLGLPSVIRLPIRRRKRVSWRRVLRVMLRSARLTNSCITSSRGYSWNALHSIS